MKKIFFGMWVLTSIIFFFFSPWNYFNPCYGKVCYDYSASPVFSTNPNFMHPACSGICIVNTEDLIFSAPNFVFDVFLAFVVSWVVIFLVKTYRRKNREKGSGTL